MLFCDWTNSLILLFSAIYVCCKTLIASIPNKCDILSLHFLQHYTLKIALFFGHYQKLNNAKRYGRSFLHSERARFPDTLSAQLALRRRFILLRLISSINDSIIALNENVQSDTAYNDYAKVLMSSVMRNILQNKLQFSWLSTAWEITLSFLRPRSAQWVLSIPKISKFLAFLPYNTHVLQFLTNFMQHCLKHLVNAIFPLSLFWSSHRKCCL